MLCHMLVSVERKKNRKRKVQSFGVGVGRRLLFFFFLIAWPEKISSRSWLDPEGGGGGTYIDQVGVEKYSRQPVPRSWGQEYWHAPGTEICCGWSRVKGEGSDLSDGGWGRVGHVENLVTFLRILACTLKWEDCVGFLFKPREVIFFFFGCNLWLVGT